MSNTARQPNEPSFNIRELRQKHGWSMDELADLAQLTKTTIYNLESKTTKRIDLETLEKLCQVFNCTPNDILRVNLNKEDRTVNKQKSALYEILGTLSYSKPVNAKELDKDLADITHHKLNQAANQKDEA